MTKRTSIEWTDSTWNPIRGCSRVSEGCRHCYAESMASRFSGPGMPYEGLAVMQNGKRHWTGKIAFVEKHLLDPLKWKGKPLYEPGNPKAIGYASPLRIFVNSMSDLFHENVTDEMRDQIFAVMALCPQHTFQVLTKRPAAMCAYFKLRTREAMIGFAANRINLLRTGNPVLEWSGLPMPNVQLGVSVENQKAADDRLDYLCDLASQGWQTMVSFEPLLSAVDPGEWWLSLGSRTWAIVGGESGLGARPMHPDWARGLRDQCVAAGVPFFFKQWGEYLPPMTDGALIDGAQELNCSDGFVRVGKHSAGALLDGVEWKQFPEVQP